VNRKVAKQVPNVQAIGARLEAWFPSVFRDLPWRKRRNPWRVFVSEVMLQQTQASRVAEKFPAFLRRFPNPKRLAESTELSVLSLWQGLGYYRRAKNLRAAAQMIVAQYGGRVPRSVQELQTLPGIGRYSAGAIASIAFGQAAPIVDGNVARVLSRIADRRETTKGTIADEWLWSTAQKLVHAANSPAVLNEAIMELGATICTPRAPRCGECPLKRCCGSFKANSQEFVPLSNSAAPRKTVVHHACVEIRGSKIGVETRPAKGLWAGMLSPPVVESSSVYSTAKLLRERPDIKKIKKFHREFEFLTTHRTVRIRVYQVVFHSGAKLRWVDVAKLNKFAVSNAVLRMVKAALQNMQA
jgi:A/G-specific adenine glycosylase